jgi:AraC family transcriptional regulator
LRKTQRQFSFFFSKLLASMRQFVTSRTLVRRIAGPPEVTCRLASDPPLVVEWYRVLLGRASTPLLPAPILLVHTGGKPLSYTSPKSDNRGLSLPGLITVVPRLTRSEISLGGVGEGAVVYFESERRIPAWVERLAPLEPVTVVDELVSAIVQQVVATARSGSADEQYLATLGNTMLAQARHVLAQPAAVERPRGSRTALLLAHAATDHVRAHLDGDLSVAAIAKHCGVGATHFSNTFRRVTGMTPHRYVRRARIERASDLLRTTALSVGEIAQAVGFAGQSHFCTAFTLERGITPSAYRRACRSSAAPA